MNNRADLIDRLINGRAENHLLPFFWQHGEDEATLREYMRAIHSANCGAVCVESRPHPDFCGPKWWQDMDVILDEARTLGMKVWILDDSHFPTGFANGAMQNKPDVLCKQSVFTREYPLPDAAGTITLDLAAKGLLAKKECELTGIAAYVSQTPARVYHDDSLLCVIAEDETGQRIDLTDSVTGHTLNWDKPAGAMLLRVCCRTRNAGPHRDYINLTDPDSCRVLLDAVYEPHWQHYAADFGTTIAGFFSDEPELGNYILYGKYNHMGRDQDLPWGHFVEMDFAAALGAEWRSQVPLLWNREDNNAHTTTPDEARVRTIYMDVLTRRVQKSFSEQIGGWCRDHGVQYIGHMIEDDGQHCRTGSGLGHYFRGLRGQDMAGIDDIGGQILPQGENEPTVTAMRTPRSGEFYHYTLAKLAESAAVLEPTKHGNSMCEVFGNYGWVEGIRLEKYLADHLLVHGINHFVPHAFSAAPFPDPDCPPHFYAHGHNPQFRWFGALMAYMNRVADLTSADRHIAPVAVLYHGEQEWADENAMPVDTPLHLLYDAQIDCRILPADVFTEAEFYHTVVGKEFSVNGNSFKIVLVPGCESLCRAAADGLAALAEAGVPVLFVGKTPHFVSETNQSLPEALRTCETVELNALVATVRSKAEIPARIRPGNDRIRVLEIGSESPMYFIVNEGTSVYTGTVHLPDGTYYLYDPLANCCHPAEKSPDSRGVKISVAPLHSIAIISGTPTAKITPVPTLKKTAEITHWTRSACDAPDYPHFESEQDVTLPDHLAVEQPEFSGFVRYETMISDGSDALEIEDAGECVEVFVNGESLGLQLVPPFVYDLRGKLHANENRLSIIVATTLERQVYPQLQGYRKLLAPKPTATTGLTGHVWLCQKQDEEKI